MEGAAGVEVWAVLPEREQRNSLPPPRSAQSVALAAYSTYSYPAGALPYKECHIPRDGARHSKELLLSS